MARADDVPDLMCQAVAYRRTVIMHDGKRLLRIGVHAGCQAAALRVIGECSEVT